MLIGLSKEATKNSYRESINTDRPRIPVKTQKKAPSSLTAPLWTQPGAGQCLMTKA